MSKTKAPSVKKNFIYSSLYQTLTLVTPLLTAPYVSRIFGPTNLGIFSYTNTIAQYFVLFGMLGLTNYGNRTIAMVRDDKEKLNVTFSQIYSMQFITGSVALCAYLIFSLLISKDYRIYSLILTIYVLAAIFDINWLFFGLENFKLTVVRSSIVKIVSVAAIFIFVKTDADLWIYILIQALAFFMSTLILWPFARKVVLFSLPKWRDVAPHFKTNSVMFIPVVAVSIYKYMDKLMLGGFSKTEAGYYENAEKLFTVALGFVTAFGNVMLPRMANLSVTSKGDMAKGTIRTSMRFIMGLSFAIAFGLAGIAQEFVPLYFGDNFNPCIAIIYGLAPTAVFTSWASVIRTQYLIPFKKDNVYVMSVIIGAITNAVVNAIIIPIYGAMGAVIGTIVAELTVAVIQTVFVRRNLTVGMYLIQSFPFLLSGYLMYLLIRVVSNIDIPLLYLVILEFIAGAVLYCLIWGGYEWLIRKKLGNSGGVFCLMKYRIKKAMFPTKITSDEYTQFLKDCGLEIGKRTYFFDPSRTNVDVQRPWMLHIGEYVKITSGVIILCHDYSRSVLRRAYGPVIGEGRKTFIGDNVFLGVNTIVCMGAHIGNNVIIGAGSVVTGIIPDDCVAAGNPAKVICSLDEYYQKRKQKTEDEAICYAISYRQYKGRWPSPAEMGPFFPLFEERTKEALERDHIFTSLSGDSEEEVINDFIRAKPVYESYEAFISRCSSTEEADKKENKC